MRAFAFALIASGLAACTPQMDVGSSLSAYKSARSCCADFGQMAYEKLSGQQDTYRFTVGDDDPAFMFPGSGLSRFKAFELPDIDAPYTLVLRSYLFNALRPPKTSGFFFPKLTLLDASKQVVAQTDLQQLVHIKSSYSDEPAEMHRLEVLLPVKPGDRARYLLIHTFADSLGTIRQFHGQTSPMTVPVGNVFVSLPGPSDLYAAIGSPTAPPQSLKLQIRRSVGQ